MILRKKKLLFMVLLLTVSLLISLGSAVMAECTMFVAGKGATEDGSVLLARNEDFAGNWAKHIILNQARETEEEETIESENGLTWGLPETTLKYLSVKDWDNVYGRFHECAINSQQVAITATTTASQNEKAKEADPLIDDGLGENIVTTLVAQRAETAREGVKLVGEIIEEKGASECFALAIGDTEEAWILEVGGGYHWVARRVPDDSYFVGANALRIGQVDLEDTENYLGSEDLIQFAIDNGLYDPDSEEEFHFARAYGTADDYSKSNYRRVWGGIDFFNPELEADPEAQNYPLFLEPPEEIAVSEAMALLRYHYQGTEFDPMAHDVDERPIGTSSTIESHVLQLRDDYPDPLGGVQWIAMSTPLTSVYVPYYVGVSEVPDVYQTGTDSYDDNSAYWTFRSVANLALTDWEQYGEKVREARQQFEKKQFASQAELEDMVQELYEEKPDQAVEFLNDYSRGRALQAYHQARELRAELMTEMSKQ